MNSDQTAPMGSLICVNIVFNIGHQSTEAGGRIYDNCREQRVKGLNVCCYNNIGSNCRL